MKRAYYPLLKEYLRYFPCVAIVGPRQCGKTTFLSELPPGWRRFDLEASGDFQNLSRDPDLFFRLNPEQVAIDEAQLLPELFPALRVAIDSQRRKKGRFVITGSSSPRLISSISESLAGRIGMIEMAPFSCVEAHGKQPGPFYDLLPTLSDPREFPEKLKPRLDLRRIHKYWFYGGYPEPWLVDQKRFRELWMEQYATHYIQRDISRLFPGLNQNTFRRFIQILGGCSGTIVNISETARSLQVSQPTAREYFEIAQGTFLWRQLPPYEKKALKRIVKHPKGYLRDTGLLHHMQRVPDLKALLVHPQMGQSWEGLVIEEILRGLNMKGIGYDCYYYRTGAGAEVDLILEGDFGLVPIEIKYNQNVSVQQLRGIHDFVQEKKCGYGIVINNDDKIRFYSEKVVGIPFAFII